MDALPLEILSRILDLFTLKEKLKLREVCKNFLFVIDNRTEKSLMMKRTSSSLGAIWFDDLKKVCSGNSINHDMNIGIFYSNLFESRFFINLKKLYLNYGYDSSFKKEKIAEKQLTFLNNFQQLETLYLDLLGINEITRPVCELNKTTKIELNELKNLDIAMFHSNQLLFDFPKLSFISASSFAFLNIVNPRTVTRIESRALKEDLSRLGKFVNLECFNYIFWNYSTQHLKELVTQSKKLKILGLAKPKTKDELIELKQFLEKRTIEVYLGGVHISRWDPLGWDDLDFLKFYLDSYPFHRFPPLFSTVNYAHWQELVDSRALPINFQSRLPYLHKLVVTKKINRPDQFIKFIENCKMLRIVFLENSSLGDEFYSNLPSYSPYVNFLTIKDDENRIKKIDFSFLLKLVDLFYFKTNYQLALSLIRNLVLNSNLQAIAGFFEDKIIWVGFSSNRQTTLWRETENVQLKQFEEELNKELERSSRKTFTIMHPIKDQN